MITLTVALNSLQNLFPEWLIVIKTTKPLMGMPVEVEVYGK